MREKIKAYIAGFLDGDGCIMFQLVKRKDYIYLYQIRASIVFYQRINNIAIICWLKSQLKDGYIRERKDYMAEYTIVGINKVMKVLMQLKPYLRLKRKHVLLAQKIAGMMQDQKKINPEKFLKAAKLVDQFKDLNYSKKRVNTSKQLREHLLEKKIISP